MFSWILAGQQTADGQAADGLKLGRRWRVVGLCRLADLADRWLQRADWSAGKVGLLTTKASVLSFFRLRCPSSPLCWVIRVRAAALPSQYFLMRPKLALAWTGMSTVPPFNANGVLAVNSDRLVQNKASHPPVESE